MRTNLGLIQQDINVVWDLAPHDLSIILSILGRAPESVNCQGRAHYNPGIEDVAMVTLIFPTMSWRSCILAGSIRTRRVERP